MTAVVDRLKLGEERRLIFQNIANGVPAEKLKAAFLRSEEEIWREVEFVGRKIREYRFRRHMPPLACMGLRAIRLNRAALLETLRKLGPEYLSSELLIPRIGIHQIDTVEAMTDTAQRINNGIKK